jgi:hypothetical protein
LNQSTPKNPAAYDQDYKDLLNRYGEIENELEARAAAEQAVRV